MNESRQANTSPQRCGQRFPGRRITGPLGAILLLSLSLLAAGAGSGAAQQAIAPPAPSETKKIVFLSGPKDHGAPGRHESIKDLQVIQWVLDNSTNLTNVTTQFYEGVQRPPLSEFSDADAIVILASGDRLENEMHPLFPANAATDGVRYDQETTAYLNSLDQWIRQNGVGVVVLHYAMYIENEAGRRYHMNWLGGLWIQGGSQNPVDDWTMTPMAPEHPIFNGVRPWTYRDEIFSRFFLPRDPRRIDLILGTPHTHASGPQVAGWAYERADGGRAFVYGGVDFHEPIMTVEDYRQFLVNGVAWAAGIEIPEEGILSGEPPAELGEPTVR